MAEATTSWLSSYAESIKSLVDSVDVREFEAVVELLHTQASSGAKTLFFGNGGSCSICSHLMVDWIKAGGLRAYTPSDCSLITCFANDYGHDRWMAEALKATVSYGDIVIAISSSGESENIVNLAKECRDLGTILITLTGFSQNNRLSKLGMFNFWVDSAVYNHVEIAHKIVALGFLDSFIHTRK